MTKPKIYGFLDRHHGSNWVGVAISEDGNVLGSHVSSDESWLRYDLGMVEGNRSKWRDEKFLVHYPDGYETEYVIQEYQDGHQGLQRALAKNREEKTTE